MPYLYVKGLGKLATKQAKIKGARSLKRIKTYGKIDMLATNREFRGGVRITQYDKGDNNYEI
jgi:hypothetical protein